jgi:hypothetical protein
MRSPSLLLLWNRRVFCDGGMTVVDHLLLLFWACLRRLRAGYFVQHALRKGGFWQLLMWTALCNSFL